MTSSANPAAPPDSAVAGIDLGSTTIKVVIWDGFRYLARITPATWDPACTALSLLASASRAFGLQKPPAIFAATGYGRGVLKEASLTPTEITCHARGAGHLLTGCRFVIDIGGQDAKGIRLAPGGDVADFVMNDKCAAGTGRFLSATGRALGVNEDQLPTLARGTEPHRINAMCTVFAESEVISLVNQGVERRAIIAGLHAAIARRTASMVAPLHPQPPIAFTGGVSQNADIAERLAATLGYPVIVPPDAIYAGAIGAALLAWDRRQNP